MGNIKPIEMAVEALPPSELAEHGVKAFLLLPGCALR